LGFGYWFNTCGFWGYGSPYYVAPYAYYCAPAPVYYTYIVEDYVDQQSAAEPVAYESEAAVGEGNVYPASQDRSNASAHVAADRPNASATRAANDYLTVGDRAFRDGRYSDAVYAYAKAVELVPDDGVLHLILSDALFATGDYHYCAYALRRAIELDPKLIESVVDKRTFYGDPHEFDRQLSLLERYVEDHFLDDDARLVLAANYLFSNRPELTSDLLQSAFSLSVRESPAGRVIAARGQALRQAGTSPH
jgi:tetratricopeptide (TPR) repeat protein